MRASASALRSDRDRIGAVDIHRDERCSRRGDVADQAAAARHHDRPVAGGRENAHELNGSGIGGAGMQARRDDQHGERSAGRGDSGLRCRVFERRKRCSSIRSMHDADCGWLRTHGQRPDRFCEPPSVRPFMFHPLEIARQERRIDRPHRLGNALRRKHVFGELPRARGHLPIGAGIRQRQRGAQALARNRPDRRALPPSRCARPPACAAARRRAPAACRRRS